MSNFVGDKLEVYCAECHRSMGIVTIEEFKACLWVGGVWAEKCFDCEGKGGESGKYPEFFLEFEKHDTFFIGDCLFMAEDFLMFKIVHTHACVHAPGLSSSTYLNTRPSAAQAERVEESGNVGKCSHCGGWGNKFKNGWWRSCELCNGTGKKAIVDGETSKANKGTVFLEIPAWILQPKVFSGVRPEDDHLFADWKELEENEHWTEQWLARLRVAKDE